MYPWKPDNYQMMWKHFLIHGDNHANSQPPLDGSAVSPVPFLKLPQPQGTEDEKSLASCIPWALPGQSNTGFQAMGALQSLEFTNLGTWSVLKFPKLTHSCWKALNYEKILSGARMLQGFQVTGVGSRSQPRVSRELPRFHSDGSMARNPWKLGVDGLALEPRAVTEAELLNLGHFRLGFPTGVSQRNPPLLDNIQARYFGIL
ncbi:hypothetical protein BTVI_58624 [Pitangus sulphuratus]|nr:hypothetical protein BTVI_58624 [Pitangus sulphuratus]